MRQAESALWRAAEPRSLLPSFLEGLADALPDPDAAAAWPDGSPMSALPQEDAAPPLSRLLFALCSSGVVLPSQPHEAQLKRPSPGSCRAAGAEEEGAALTGSGSSCAGELIGALHAAGEPDQDARREAGGASHAAGGDAQQAAHALGALAGPEQPWPGEPEQTRRALEAAASIEPLSPEAALLPLAAARMDGAIEQGIRLWSPKKGGVVRAGSGAGGAAVGQLGFEAALSEAGSDAGCGSIPPFHDDDRGIEIDTARVETSRARAASPPEAAAVGEGGAGARHSAQEGGTLDEGVEVGHAPPTCAGDGTDMGGKDGCAPAPIAMNGADEGGGPVVDDGAEHGAVVRPESAGGSSAEQCGPSSGQQKGGWRARMGRAVGRVSNRLKPRALAPTLKADRDAPDGCAAGQAAVTAAAAVAGGRTRPAAAEHGSEDPACSYPAKGPSAAQPEHPGTAAPEMQDLRHSEPAGGCNGGVTEEASMGSSDAAVSHRERQHGQRGGLLRGNLAKLAWKARLRDAGAFAQQKSSLAASEAGVWPELEEVARPSLPNACRLPLCA